MAELQHAIASFIEHEPSFDKEALATGKSILSACLGLLAHCKASGIVELVHSTARDVIIGSLGFNNQSSQINIGKACLRYMSSPEVFKGSCPSLEALKARLDAMPFLEYSARHYGEHIGPCSRPIAARPNGVLRQRGLEASILAAVAFRLQH
ncbi:hypothetical protein VTK26DRAFT_9333 [Humicola hyalothermophila]